MLSRYGMLALVLGSVSVLATSGCDGGGGGDGGAGAGGGAGASGGGGSQANAPVILPPNSSGKSCENGESSCKDQAAIEEYEQCAIDTCDGEYKQCFGDAFLTGTFGGPCKDLMECANQCQDCDQACLSACSDQHYAGACEECITGPIFDCVVDALKSGTCKIPCGPSTGGGVCDELEACCNSITDMQKHDECLELHGQIQLGGDSACSSALGTYKSSGVCQ